MNPNNQVPVSGEYLSNDSFNKEINNLIRGKLNREKLESKNTEFVNTDFSEVEKGSVNDNYGQSHDLNNDEPNVATPTTTRRKVSESYLAQHDDHIDRSAEKTTDIRSIATGNRQEDKGKGIELRIPIDVQAKNDFHEKNKTLCYGSSVILYQDEFGCYEEQTEASLHVAIRKSLSPEMDMKLGKHKIYDVVHRIVSSPENQTTCEKLDSYTHLINFKNGVLDTKNGKSYPHSPEYLFTSYIDAEYGESSPTVRVYHSNQNRRPSNQGYYFMKFLEDCTDGDPLKIKSLQQLTGYIISNEWRAKKFFVLIGPPHTGKSVWLALWRSLIGPKHTTAMSLKQLGETRFMTAELFKSKLNISAEMDECGAIKGTDIIKTITGGDLITAERKGKDPFQFYGKTKLVAAGNHMPSLSKLDGTSAFTDRILFLVFNTSIQEDQRDKSLMDKLINEKTYIVEWALEGLRELMKNNLIFTESKEAHAFKLRYINGLNNVPEFTRDMCHIDLLDEDCKVHRKTLFPIYKQYCHDNGYKPLSKQEFYVEISKLNVNTGKMRINGSMPLEGFRGIRLQTQAEQKLKLL